MSLLIGQCEKKRTVFVHFISRIRMHKVHQLFILVILTITTTKSYNFSSCIPNTSCQCYLTQYSFTLLNCSYTLYDLPVFDSKNTANITKISARNALTQWPNQLCKYSNIQIL